MFWKKLWQTYIRWWISRVTRRKTWYTILSSVWGMGPCIARNLSLLFICSWSDRWIFVAITLDWTVGCVQIFTGSLDFTGRWAYSSWIWCTTIASHHVIIIVRNIISHLTILRVLCGHCQFVVVSHLDTWAVADDDRVTMTLITITLAVNSAWLTVWISWLSGWSRAWVIAAR